MDYTEIRNNYMFGPGAEHTAFNEQDDLFAGITIDTWKTGDDNEQGTVVAQVLMTKSGDIVTAWNDNSSRMNRSILDAIEEAKEELRQAWSSSYAPKIYCLRDSEDGDAFDVIRVNNPDDDFEQRLIDAFTKWLSSEGEYNTEVYGALAVYGYDIDILEFEQFYL